MGWIYTAEVCVAPETQLPSTLQMRPEQGSRVALPGADLSSVCPQALPYVCLLIAMLFFIYAIIGMQVGVPPGWAHKGLLTPEAKGH